MPPPNARNGDRVLIFFLPPGAAHACQEGLKLPVVHCLPSESLSFFYRRRCVGAGENAQREERRERTEMPREREKLQTALPAQTQALERRNEREERSPSKAQNACPARQHTTVCVCKVCHCHHVKMQ